MNIFKGELLKEGKVIRAYSVETSIKWSIWRFTVALEQLNPRGEEIKWYMNGTRKYS